MLTRKWLLLSCVLIGIVGMGDYPRAEDPPAAFYAIGDLPGGGATTVIRDATQSGGVIYAVGGAVTRQTTCGGVAPPGAGPCAGTDTPILWRFDGINPATLEALPDINPSAAVFPLGSASDITPDGRYVANQTRKAVPGLAPWPARVDTSLLPSPSANLDLGTLLPALGAGSTALAISSDGTILYGNGNFFPGPVTRAIRFDTTGATTLVIPLLGSYPQNNVATRGTSTDGTVVVGTSFGVGLPQAYRYEHGSGVSAIPTLPGGTVNAPLAVSPDGDLVLMSGNSAANPNPEAYLWRASTNAIEALGSPNAAFRTGGRVCANGICNPAIQIQGGMTADGSVVAMNFTTPPPTVESGHAYLHNANGWFHFASVLGANGVDITADGWQNLVITSMSSDGTLVFGAGEHNGVVEGFVARFADGVLAGFNPQPAPPVSTALVGVWGLCETDDEMCDLNDASTGGGVVFTADGAYYEIEDSGFERGLYTYDGSVLTFTTLLDTNGTDGASSANGRLLSPVIVAGDTIMPGGPLVGFRIPGSIAEPLVVGAWVNGNPTLPDSSFVAVFLDSDRGNVYFTANDNPDFGDDGVEVGTYTWDPVTHQLDVTPFGGTPDVGNFATPAPDGLSIHVLGDDGEEFDLTRVVDPATIPVIANTPLSASGVVGQAFSYDVDATNTATFTATGLPDGLSINSSTGEIGGPPGVGGQFAVTILATSAIGVSDIETLTLTIAAVNDAPTAHNGTLTTAEDTAANGTLLATDVDGPSLTFSIVTNTAKGTATITNAATGAYTYTPSPNANGSDSFTFQVSDGFAISNVATITVDITPVGDAPAALSGVVTTSERTAVSGTLQAADIDTAALTFSVATPPAHGVVVLDATTGAFTYTPNAGAFGYDPFTFNITDGTSSSQATESVFVVANPRRWPGQTARASVSSGGAQGNSQSTGPLSLSADGRFVAFASSASNLVAADTNGTTDAFVHDLQTGQTTRVSIASSGAQANSGNSDPKLSADGRFVAFRSNASNLVADDTNGLVDVFVHDRQTGQTTRASVGTGGVQGTVHIFEPPALSADGRFVVFVSAAPNLMAGDTNGVADVFVHDRQTGQTTRVSVASDGSQANSAAVEPAVSADGRFVAFRSTASNLVAGDTNNANDVFVHDRQTGQTTRVSLTSAGAQMAGDNLSPAVSADGRFVAFHSGSPLAAGDANVRYDVYVHDRQTGQTTIASVATSGAQGNFDSAFAALSADGRYVAFLSPSSTLAAGDSNGKADVFLHDRQTGQTTRVSVATDGAEANDDNDPAALSADVRFVSYSSAASNLVAGDTNGTRDVLVAISAPADATATPVITWATPAAITYGTPLGPTQLTATADVPGSFDYTPVAGTLLGAGPAQPLSVTFTPEDDTQYAPATATVSLTVNPAVALVTPDNQTRWTGAANPPFTYTLSNFVLGDTAAVVNGTPSITTPADAASTAGTYPIIATQGTLSAANYAFAFVNGTLTIELSPCDPAFARPIDDLMTLVGSGAAGFAGGGFAGDGGLTTSALLKFPNSVAVGGGFLYIADTNNHRVRRVNLATCAIDTVAGNGTAGFAGNDGQATAARLNAPRGVAVANGWLYIADTNNHRVRRVDLATGFITAFAGSGDFSFGGDGGPATSAGINGPFKVTVADGGVFIADRGNHRIRRVDLASNVITTVAGNGVAAFAGDGGAATSASLNLPTDMVVGNGALFIADRQNARVRRVDLTTGFISTVAGNGSFGAAGIGPAGLALSGTRLYISDEATPRVQQLDLTTGTLSTVAGTGVAGFSGDGGAGTAAQLDNPSGLALVPGALYIADTFNQRVRRLQLRTDQTTLTVLAPASAVFGSTFTVTTDGGSGTGAVTFAASGACSTAGADAVTMTSGSGNCLITAMKAADAQFFATQSAAGVVPATRAAQATLTVEGAPSSAVIGTQFVVSVTGGSGVGAVTLAATGACESDAQDPFAITITATTGTCTVTATKSGDANYVEASSAPVVVAVADSTPPLVTVVAPDRDALITVSPATVTVDASDIAGVVSVAVNGVGATLVSGTSLSGRWEAIVPVDLTASALTFNVTATDASDNSSTVGAVVDNDGIASAIDRARNDYAVDQGSVFSLQFNDATTSGEVTGTRGQYVVSKPGSAVRVQLVGQGQVNARFCNGTDKYVRLDTAAEIADASCNGSTVTVTAVAAAPAIEVYKQTTGVYYQSYTSCYSYRCGFGTCTSCYTTTYPVNYTYYYRIDLAAGQTVSTGSPVVADPSNTSPIVVTLVQISEDGLETAVGSFELDPGESAEVTQITPGPNRQDAIELTVLEGEVTATINGETQVLAEGVHSMQPELTAPVCQLTSSAPDPTGTSPIPVAVTFSEPVSGFNASSMVVANATVSNFTGSGSFYTFNLVPSGVGLVSATIPAGAVTDAAGNVIAVPATLTRTFVQKQNQSVSFAPIPNMAYGSGPLTLNATASSGLPVSFSATGSCSVSGTTLTLQAVGVCTVTASQAGGDLYYPAPAVVQSFQVLPALASVVEARAWLGLKNSDDQGTRFDLLAEIYRGSTLLASGLTRCITGVTRNANSALQAIVPFAPLSQSVPLTPGEVLTVRLSTRIGTNTNGASCGGHSNATGLRLYYDAPTRPSKIRAQIVPGSPTDYFLHLVGSALVLNPQPPAGAVQFKDSPAVTFAGGNPWKTIGGWALTVP